jgi:hypothetical protein
MNSLKCLKIFLLLLTVIPVFPGITLFAAETVVVDSSKIDIRQPDQKFVESYRSQKAFVYSKPPVQIHFLKRLWSYLLEHYKSLENVTKALPWIIKGLLWLLLLFFVFIVITQTKVYKVFYSSKEIKSPISVHSLGIDPTTDFDSEIRLNVEQKQFRMAVRLLYLKVIQQLRDKNFIHYSKDKTNVDYLRELSNTDIKSEFYRVTRIYNHVWYGDVEIIEEQYLAFEKSFQSLYSTINVQE